MRGKLICPLCGGPLEFGVIDRVDFVGEGVTLFSFHCTKCGYRGVDVFPERAHEPRRIEFRVRGPEDLNVLVARSSTATVRIPELGAMIEPGPASQGFITTVEGILVRIRDRFHREAEVVQKIDRMLNGEEFTLVIEDPFGTSAIDTTEANIVVLKRKPFKTP